MIEQAWLYGTTMCLHLESNLLPRFNVRIPENIALKRSRNVGALVLSTLKSDYVAADLFAGEFFSPQPTYAQHRMLCAVVMSIRVNINHALGVGTS